VPYSLVPGKNRTPFLCRDPDDTLSSWYSSRMTDPLVHHGRHFGRTVYALCSVTTLVNNGILRTEELADHPEASLSHEYVSETHSYELH
jgi:hypothetical protein